MNGATAPLLGIGRRRGAEIKKPYRTSIIVVAASFSLTLLIILGVLGHMSFSSSSTQSMDRMDRITRRPEDRRAKDARERADAAEEEASREFLRWGGIMRAESHLISVEAFGALSAGGEGGGAGYRGVQAKFCKLDWERYKADPPSLPMFRILVSASGCDKKKNVMKMDLAEVVRKVREYERIQRARNERGVNGSDDLHVMPPAGFVFHESRVGSTLVANALTAMDPEGHRVYSESDPINKALKVCEGKPPETCDADANAELFRDVVYLMGRTSSPKEKRMFFKVSSIGSKRIDVMRRAFPSVPWIFVFRDPVQTMMSHLYPARGKVMRGGAPSAVCLRARPRPPPDLVELARGLGGEARDLSYEEFCAAHLATLCESAWRAMKASDGRGVAVEYDGLTERLIRSVIPGHFGVEVDAAARQRILDVAKVYSKSKNGNKDWVEDSQRKDDGSTPEIRRAGERFLLGPYERLRKLSIH